MPALRVGFAVADITPPAGTPLGGYLARPRFQAQGVHDRLHVKVIALGDGSQLLLLCSLDLLGLTAERSAALAHALAGATGLQPEEVVLACTHTHSGPNTLPMRGIPDVDESYYQLLERQLCAAGKASLAAQRRASLQVAAGRSDVGVNRRNPGSRSIQLQDNPAGTYDDALLMLRFHDAGDGRPIGAVACYGCHLTALGSQNMLISAEWAGLAMNRLQEELGHPCVFLNGAFGNINPRARGETWERTDEIAASFARDCLDTLRRARTEEAMPLVLARQTVALPLAPLAPDDEIARLRIEANEVLAGPAVDEVSRRVYAVRRQYAEAVDARRLACTVEESRVADLVALRLGKVALVGMPGEAFAEYSLWLRQGSPFPYTMVLGNVGYELGYLPTALAFSEGGYEPTSFVYFCDQGYSPAIEDILLDGGRSLLRRLGQA